MSEDCWLELTVSEQFTSLNGNLFVDGKDSRIEYLILYKNAGDNSDVWVQENHPDDCPKLVSHFEDELAKTVSVENNFLTHQNRLNKQAYQHIENEKNSFQLRESCQEGLH
ncbi:hypothetical protein DICPUDRAFT_77910 [Dictyostelium purpureum]|uniref:Uncharacterized protein n=1 Tax=Dictyostelium purpureum TaxID=5786 RepID=F0ZI00_DICPU|nr:uncharacterized protein DICPUDRAFT_77910 [Dictyostelium purpureum]EGC36424.1 hypothetical protein DICPUDRAFT_77910 [Dictyostelium purpureum]|eukprot:XP_003287057.1 hypothetical protein DICPUDRAFT_77910 [Dictyostelium purpureum]